MPPPRSPRAAFFFSATPRPLSVYSLHLRTYDSRRVPETDVPARRQTGGSRFFPCAASGGDRRANFPFSFPRGKHKTQFHFSLTAFLPTNLRFPPRSRAACSRVDGEKESFKKGSVSTGGAHCREFLRDAQKKIAVAHFVFQNSILFFPNSVFTYEPTI